MKEKIQNNKQKRQSDWLIQHTMTEADQKKMIREKFERARAYHEALQKREVLLKGR